MILDWIVATFRRLEAWTVQVPALALIAIIAVVVLLLVIAIVGEIRSSVWARHQRRAARKGSTR